jgi:diguanylate cyclase
VALGCFMFIAMLRPAEFHWHAMSLAIMLIVVYLYIPNSFVNALLLAFASTIALLTLALRLAHMTPGDIVTMSMLLTLANAFGALAARRFNRASREEYRAQAQLQYAAERDHLTGCYNRRYLVDQLMRPQAAAPRPSRRKLTVVLCDIDNFKRINDTYGHPTGDEMLRGLVRILKDNKRETDLVARYGGEEFAVILPDADAASAFEAANRFRQIVADTLFDMPAIGKTLRMTVSIGVALCPVDGDTEAQLIARSDAALYHAKKTGKDRVSMAAEVIKIATKPA